MAWACGRQRIGRRQWPLLGLLLIASFLGHDLLMAAEAGAAPISAGPVHHAPTPPAHGAAATAPQLHDKSPAHPENCRIGQAAVPRSGDAFEPPYRNLASALGIVATIALPGAHADAGLWQEPRWPPGTRRALFQVYRL